MARPRYTAPPLRLRTLPMPRLRALLLTFARSACVAGRTLTTRRAPAHIHRIPTASPNSTEASAKASPGQIGEPLVLTPGDYGAG
ncbi:hypothetical protein DFH08DRAFT_881608 [Mycena albidolilacea]|uniref:Uncharacterized protein n=1 Tax=Mycena albidolilacea TaxID=1033008 RepID=A0AAD6ZNZ7_9AGAR|nr:hypothetical protein DFH08DRAFT_881608 [Mycena albidolilacea]